MADEIEELIETLRDHVSWEMRKMAAEHLADIGDVRAIPALIDTFKDGVWDVEIAAIKALADIGKPAIPTLIEKLKDTDSVIRADSARALGFMSKKGHDISDAVSTLIDALNDNDEDVRLCTIETLGNVADAKVAHALVGVLGDEEVYQWEAVLALAKIAEKISEKEDYPIVLKLVKKFAKGFMDDFKGRNSREALKERREYMEPLFSLAEGIQRKMNSVDNDKKFPVKKQDIRTVRKKVITNG